MEAMLGREVQPEELQQAVQSMQGVHATVLQLATAIEAASAWTTSRTGASNSFRGGLDLGCSEEEQLMTSGLGQYSQDWGEFDQGDSSEVFSTEDGDELWEEGSQYAPTSPSIHHQRNRRCPEDVDEGGDDTEDQACCSCSSPPADQLLLSPRQNTPGGPSSSTVRSTPTPNVPTLSLGVLRSSIRMVSESVPTTCHNVTVTSVVSDKLPHKR